MKILSRMVGMLLPFLLSCQSQMLPPPEKAPLPLAAPEMAESLGVESIDETDLEDHSSKTDYEPFNPKGLYVYFGVNQTSISAKSKPTLLKIKQGMERDPLSRIIIRAHTDSSGSRKHNLELSRKRAMAIKTYLVNLGIAANRLRVSFAGEAETVGKAKSTKDRRRSRRAEFLLDDRLKRNK